MRPTLLDVCCCEGGASAGYADAGFDVTGVDLVPMKQGIVWRNLSAPQRAALRLLRDRGTTAVADYGTGPRISHRCARSLLEMGAAVLAGSQRDYRNLVWLPFGSALELSAAGRAAIGDRA